MWSNDVIKSTMHRVVEPPIEVGQVHPSRYSIAYFGQPNLNALIEGIPGTAPDGEKNKYEPVTSGGYLTMRLTATYAY
jgi:isopenicillin N synthase-like dioxygenase